MRRTSRNTTLPHTRTKSYILTLHNIYIIVKEGGRECLQSIYTIGGIVAYLLGPMVVVSTRTQKGRPEHETLVELGVLLLSCRSRNPVPLLSGGCEAVLQSKFTVHHPKECIVRLYCSFSDSKAQRFPTIHWQLQALGSASALFRAHLLFVSRDFGPRTCAPRESGANLREDKHVGTLSSEGLEIDALPSF